MSNYEFAKPWGSEKNFAASYGLKPDPDGYAEAREIMDAMKAADARWQAEQSQGRGGW